MVPLPDASIQCCFREQSQDSRAPSPAAASVSVTGISVSPNNAVLLPERVDSRSGDPPLANSLHGHGARIEEILSGRLKRSGGENPIRAFRGSGSGGGTARLLAERSHDLANQR